ncbi:potassium-transporting ATPase subunit KdpC [Leptospira wolffii]|uniref:potassium-transporting ATPase subunit KdpC n=1 Tax=Leptospira wolffii TaxID=409998 RepID=UPI001084305F|nr:potassium-transporting ATPase subunit KdpC [Leptospira wolffii]TGL54857.1 potassium-transporting ATPase subunit KdpC [Leptospira wolffii]
MIRGLRHLILWTFLCGILYPILVFGTARIAFAKESSGSLLRKGDSVLGSELLAQKFDSSKYFRSRPSASEYKSDSGSGSNLGPSNKSLEKTVQERRSEWLSRGGGENVPTELLHSSGSGLDPHLSPEAVRYQIPIVAKAREIGIEELERAVQESIEGPQWGIFGPRKINVLKLNLKLDSRGSI